jgi:hypothetical protein
MEANQTQFSAGLVFLQNKIKQDRVAELDQAMAGHGLADGASHPCVLHQTRPYWPGHLDRTKLGVI